MTQRRQTGETLTGVIITALRERLNRIARQKQATPFRSIERRSRRVPRRFGSFTRGLAEEIIAYNENADHERRAVDLIRSTAI